MRWHIRDMLVAMLLHVNRRPEYQCECASWRQDLQGLLLCPSLRDGIKNEINGLASDAPDFRYNIGFAINDMRSSERLK